MQLTLESITLTNFKSYKGEHKIENIDKSLTAIVGPNGSGKSNIIDSILFVLGFRAKKMRHTQLTDLIYNDGNKESFCSVELSFNKFKIKREIYKNKSSKYFLNNKEITSNELIQTMTEEGIDMEHNRFLILQGEIESIAMLKPKDGLLEFLEDIIGSTKFKKQIEKLMENAKYLEEENLILQNNLKFTKTEYDHISELKKQNEEVVIKKVKYSKYMQESKKLNIELIKRKINENLQKANLINEKIIKMSNLNLENKNVINMLEQEQNSIKSISLEKEKTFLRTKREYKIAERNNFMQKELHNKLKKQINILQTNYKSIKEKNKMKNKENEILSKELRDNETELVSLKEKENVLKSKQTEENEKFKVLHKKDFDKLKKSEKVLLDLIKKSSEQNQKNIKHKTELKNLQEEKHTHKEEMNSLRAKLNACTDVKHLNKEKIENEIADIESDITKTQNEIQKRKTRYNEVYQREEKHKKEKEIIEHFNKIEGVIGRLCDIGTVDMKYELAFKVSCGRSNNIVVNTTATAEACINIIKKKNLMRSTFIILDKIQEIPKLTKYNLPYMYEMINCDSKYQKCFYFALSDTLVAESLETAQEYAFDKNRKRVVTLDGKLIEKSGVMTGGKYHEKAKRYEDIEKALVKMLQIKEAKVADLKKITEFENQKTIQKTLGEKEKIINELRKLIEVKKSQISENTFETKIKEVKFEIEEIKSNIQKFCDTTLSGDLQIINEKIEILDKRNLDIKIVLAEKIEDVNEIEEEINAKVKQLEQSEIISIEALKLQFENEEKNYNEVLSNFKSIQDDLNKLKKKMGSDYHTEIDLKSQLDQINETSYDLEKKKTEENDTLKQEIDFFISINKLLNNEYKLEDFSDEDFGSLSDDDIMDFQKKIKKKLSKMQEQIDKEIDFVIFEEFSKVEDLYKKAKEDYELQTKKYENIKLQIDELKKTRYEVFSDGLSKVNLYLKEIYKKLTYGGNAELELIDYLDPFSDGIRLAIMPPKKCWKNVSNLSGGEKTLSSLSLIFALHKYKPSPFYVMDEIDAALDFRNVSIISQYIKEMSKNSQFLIISLRNDMFEISNSILGVYKINNISRFLLINVDNMKSKLINA